MKRPGSLSVSSIYTSRLIKMLLVNTPQDLLTDEICDYIEQIQIFLVVLQTPDESEQTKGGA